MGSHVAISCVPLGDRIREDQAIFAGGATADFLAAFTLLNDSVACATIKLTAFFAHEEALITFSYVCTNHFNNILSLEF